MSDDQGLTWLKRSFPFNQNEYVTDIAFFDAYNGAVSTSDGNLYVTADQGMTWYDKTPTTSNPGAIYSICYGANVNHIIVAEGTDILVTIDGNLTWQSTFQGRYVLCMKKDMRGILYAIASTVSYARMIRSTDLGRTWA